jgi:tetratricopeptide (TPR) repeat protein
MVSPLIAKDLLKHGRLDEARAAFHEILQRESDNREALLALYRIEKRCGNEVAACEHLRAVAALDPGNVQILADLAALLRSLDRIDESIGIYQQVLALDPQHCAAHLALAWIARARHHYPAAEAHFAAAVEHLRTAAAAEPKNIQVQAKLAAALRGRGLLDEAEAMYRGILAVDPRHSASHDGLGWIAHERGDEAAAFEHLRAATQITPSDLAAQINLAKLLAATDRVGEAKMIYARITDQAPKSARIRVGLGRLARTWQDWTGALEQFRAAVECDPSNVGFRIEQGHALHELSRWEDAYDIFHAVLEDSPQNVEAVLGLAETSRACGDPGAALAWFERAAELAPFDHRPKRAIRHLKTAQGSYDWKTEIADAVAVTRATDVEPDMQIEAAKTLVQYGLTEAAAPVLSRLQAQSSAARQLVLALRQIERMGLAQPLVAGTAYPDPIENQLESLQGFLEKPVPGSDTLLLVFAGSNNRMWITLSLLHRMLRKTGVSVVYNRDLQYDWYAGGVVGLGEDFESTVEGFRQLARRHGAKRILTLGNCVGCLAALRFGMSLQAEGVLGLGPKMRAGVSMKPQDRISLGAFREKLGATRRTVQDEYLDSRERPRVTLIYGEHCSGDAEEARAMAKVPGVMATPIPGSADPDSLKDLLLLGLLEPVLLDFVANAAIAPSIHAQISGTIGLGSIQ